MQTWLCPSDWIHRLLSEHVGMQVMLDRLPLDLRAIIVKQATNMLIVGLAPDEFEDLPGLESDEGEAFAEGPANYFGDRVTTALAGLAW